MTPLCSFMGGGFQDKAMLVDVTSSAVTPLGAPLGAKKIGGLLYQYGLKVASMYIPACRVVTLMGRLNGPMSSVTAAILMWYV